MFFYIFELFNYIFYNLKELINNDEKNKRVYKYKFDLVMLHCLIKCI